jgi:hypothetical protein
MSRTTNLRTLLNGNYIDISNCFHDLGVTNAMSLYYIPGLQTVSIPSGANSNLKNANVNFKINGTDISTLYMPRYVVASNNINLNIHFSTRCITKVFFILQAPGGNGSNYSSSPNNNGGDGGTGAFVFGYINLNLNNANFLTMRIYNQTDTNNTSFISFLGGTSINVECGRGGNSNTTNVGGIGGVVSAAPSGVTYLISNNGDNGNNQGNGSTSKLTPYITANGSYYNTFYPITSSYNSYGAGGAGGQSSQSTGLPGSSGFGCVWFVL